MLSPRLSPHSVPNKNVILKLSGSALFSQRDSVLNMTYDEQLLAGINLYG